MPVRITRVKGGYRVRTPNGLKAKRTTRVKAKSLERILNAVDRGWRPTGRQKKGKR